VNEISGQWRDTLIECLTERRDRRPSGGGAVIYRPPPISTPLSSNGNGGGGEQQRQTRHRRADVGQTSPAGDVVNGAGEAGATGDVFSHTTVAQWPS